LMKMEETWRSSHSSAVNEMWYHEFV